ncbi:MAG: general secretion pathway protein GspE [Arcobacter sp.]|nr:MAG: general secretion pathway protein GspE [Arcobacter sp.]
MIRKSVRLGDLLVEEGLITNDQLMHVLKLQKEYGFSKKMGEIMIDEGYITQKQMSLLLSQQLDVAFVDLFGEKINFENLANYPYALLENAQAIPFKEDDDYIYIATSDPLNYDALEALERSIATKPISLRLTAEDDVRRIFQRLDIVKNTRSIVSEVKNEIHAEGVKTDSDESAIMRLITLAIKDAIFRKGSDLHIEPSANDMSIRVRVDGVLHESFVFDLEIYHALVSRIKILGHLDISEKRKSQDGRFSMEVEGGAYDFRLSTTPTLYGESVVMRILDQQKILLKLEDLGFVDENLEIFSEIIHSPYGILLITGPTGSGKTTTLYAALNEIKSIQNKVLTIEDPIEYQLPLVQQVQVNEKVGFTFFSALKSFLRQDPDIIMVGEIRDAETLGAAAQASLTGHMVFSTLHTNNAASAISRMSQMGLENYLIADSVLGIVAQRLVRKICVHCKYEVKPHKELLVKVEKHISATTLFFKGKGCTKCDFSGYSGRIMIAEILVINEELSKMIAKGSTNFEISTYAQEHNGFKPMFFDGLKKASQGITTLDDVLRVVKDI